MLNWFKRIYNNRARTHMVQENAKAQESGAREVASVGIRAKVIRADGSVGPDRLVCYGHRNVFIHAIAAPLAYFNGWLWERWYNRNRRTSS